MKIEAPDKQTMIQYILENPDEGLTQYTREELQAMSTAELFVLWLRR